MVDRVIKEIEDRFGKITVTRGEKHNFVGMDITFRDGGTVSILMNDYTTECFEAFGEPINKKANTPAKSDLFGVSESVNLDEDKKDLFHHIVTKLLYVSK